MPYSCAKTPPRSMSATRIRGILIPGKQRVCNIPVGTGSVPRPRRPFHHHLPVFCESSRWIGFQGFFKEPGGLPVILRLWGHPCTAVRSGLPARRSPPWA